MTAPVEEFGPAPDAVTKEGREERERRGEELWEPEDGVARGGRTLEGGRKSNDDPEEQGPQRVA